jgi:hypothetical protein
MDARKFNKIFIKTWLIIVAFLLVACVSVTIGRHQAKDWNVTSKHLKMESYSYNYCPYCGKQLKEEGKNL